MICFTKMENLNLLHRENRGNLLRKHDELLQKQQTALHLLATVKQHVTSEIVSYLSLLINPVEDLNISFLNRERLTLQFTASGVTCQRETYVDQIIRKALDNPDIYKNINCVRNARETKVQLITEFEQSGRLSVEYFAGRNRTPGRLLATVQQESDKDFWGHVEKLNYYFLALLFGQYIHGSSPLFICYIKELTRRCCLATSKEIVSKLQHYIFRLFTFMYCHLDNDGTGYKVKLFKPIFQKSSGLSMTACFKIALDLTDKEITIIPGLTRDSLYVRIAHNQELFRNMLPLSWMNKYLGVNLVEDISGQGLLQMKMALDTLLALV